MDLKILFLILMYWMIFIMLIVVGGANLFIDEGYSVNAPLNDTELGLNETSTGGIFSRGISFVRFFGFAAFGVGLPSSTPSIIRAFVALWQSSWTIFTVGFILSSIWDG